MVKLYRAEVFILDFEKNYKTEEALKRSLDYSLPDFGTVHAVQVADIGPWDDEHPLNQTATAKKTRESYFQEKYECFGFDDFEKKINKLSAQIIKKENENEELKRENRSLVETMKDYRRIQKVVRILSKLI